MRPVDIKGQRFGRLVAKRRAFGDMASNAQREAVWMCKCDCGRTAYVSAHQLRKKKHGTRSCGCLKEEQQEINLAWSPYRIKGVSHRRPTCDGTSVVQTALPSGIVVAPSATTGQDIGSAPIHGAD